MGPLRYAPLRLAMRPEHPGELYVETAAVVQSCRSLGIGTALFRALFSFASQHGYSYVRLQVVNTNANARRFYERLGFSAGSTIRMPPLTDRFAGFSAVTNMIRQLA